jgi:hypothetical protein
MKGSYVNNELGRMYKEQYLPGDDKANDEKSQSKISRPLSGPEASRI